MVLLTLRLGSGLPAHSGALHATEHAQIAVLPLLAMCDRWDIGGLSTNAHPQTGGPTIFIYDGHPGGVGITRQGYLRFEDLVRDAQALIDECPCESGCPSCVHSVTYNRQNLVGADGAHITVNGAAVTYVPASGAGWGSSDAVGAAEAPRLLRRAL